MRLSCLLNVCAALPAAWAAGSSEPIIPFSPYCLFFPEDPTCAGYIDGFAPADCSGVSPECRTDLFRFNHTVSLALSFSEYLLENTQCAQAAAEPCWTTHDLHHGRLAQGSCSIDCKRGLEVFQANCTGQGGYLCDVEYAIGLDGTEIKSLLPLCLPTSCRSKRDERAVEACLDKHICLPQLESLVPECSVHAKCAGDSLLQQQQASIAVLVCVFSLSVGLAFLSRLGCKTCTRGGCDTDGGQGVEGSQGDGNYRILDGSSSPRGHRQSGGSPERGAGSLRKPLLAPVAVDFQTDSASSRTGKFTLNENLHRLQAEGRHVLGKRAQVGVEGGGEAAVSYANPLSLSFFNLSFKYRGRALLRDISGLVPPRSCVAVVGATDSGATTLLRCLAGRAPHGKMSGLVLVNGMPPDKRMNRMISYIPKEEIHLPTLTVRETLRFAACCRLPPSLKWQIMEQRIDSWLQLLGLSHVADTVVGSATLRGVSGGERRRVSIGVECIAGHQIVIADSPTNGLDSEAAFNVIKTMRALADTGLVSFMASIRQPSPQLLGLFDTTCLMSKGRCIFYGPTAEAEGYLKGLGFARPPSKSLPDYLEELTGNLNQYMAPESQADSGDDDAQQPQRKQQQQQQQPPLLTRQPSSLRQSLALQFRKSEYNDQLGVRVFRELDRGMGEAEGEGGEATCWPGRCLTEDGLPFFLSDEFPTGLLGQIKFLVQRQVKITMRSPTLQARLGRAVFQGLLLGTMFLNAPLTQQGSTSRFGLIFITLASIAMGSVASIPELFAQRNVMYSQRASGYFRPVAWQMALLAVEIPIVALEMLLYSCLLYGLVGMRGGLLSYGFLYFYATLLTVNLFSWSISLVAVLAAPSAVAASALVPVYNSLNLLFAGFLVQASDIPTSLHWSQSLVPEAAAAFCCANAPVTKITHILLRLHSVSTIARPFRGLAVNEMKGLVFHCQETELIPFANDPLLNVSAPQGYNNGNYRACPIDTGENALQYNYGIIGKEESLSQLLCFNLLFLAIFQVLALLIIKYVDFSHYTSDDPASAGTGAQTTKRTGSVGAKDLENDVVRDSGKEKVYVEASEEKDDGSNSGDEVRTGTVEFRDLCYTVPLPASRACGPQGSKQLLDSISGCATPGQLLALMGSSGAGKTTLLDVLAGKKTGGTIEGVVTLNGNSVDKTFARYAGYVEQTDSHLPTLTVREAVEMSATLRLENVDKETVKRKVHDTLRLLRLLPFRDSLIGVPGLGGIPPEARKLVTIGVELVCEPVVLFMDEPTTGLSSAGALATMQLVRGVCRARGQSVVCTIHQPSAEVFSLFDRLLLLQKGGRVAYFGPIANMETYFTSQLHSPSLQLAQNPADYALACCAAHADAATVYKASTWRKKILAKAPSQMGLRPAAPRFKRAFASSKLKQLSYLLRVQFNFHWKDKEAMTMVCVLPIVFGLVIGSLFFDLHQDQGGARARVSLVFISLLYAGNIANMAIPKLVAARATVFRERGSNTYQLLPYYLASVIAHLPFLIMQALLFVLVFYFLVGFRTDGLHFFIFAGSFVGFTIMADSFSTLMAHVAPNADVGAILSALATSVFTLFCGFLLPYESMPYYWRWAYYLSMYRYPLEFIVANELRGLEFSCPLGDGPVGADLPMGAFPVFVGGLDQFPPPPYGSGSYSAHCAPVIGNFTDLHQDDCWHFFCPIPTGTTVLNVYSMPVEASQMWLPLFVSLGFLVGLQGLGLLALRFIQHIKR